VYPRHIRLGRPNNIPAHHGGGPIREVRHIAHDLADGVAGRRLLELVNGAPLERRLHGVWGVLAHLDHFPGLEPELGPIVCYERHVRLEVVVL